MKSVTEFSVFTLNRAQTLKSEMLASGKTPEEIQQALGESFKLEGDKLKHFWNSLELMQDQKDLKRIIAVTFAEGETVPDRVKKVEEHHYMIDYFTAPRPAQAAPAERKGKGRGGPRRGGGKGRDGAPRGERGGSKPQSDQAEKKAAPANKS